MPRILTVFVAAVGLAIVLAAWPAEAQTKKKQRNLYRSGNTVFISRDETGRTRTRIIVQPRSYLDGGTEVLPGERKFSDYAMPPYYSPMGNALGPGQGFRERTYSSPSPWDIPGIGTSF